MHATSMETMRRCIDWYLPKDPSITVLDLGATDVNGSYRSLLPEGIGYIGVDLEPGPGVDVVLEDPYILPFADASVDLVISGQMLEHCGQFWRVFTEVKRVLKPGGLAFMIAPSSGPVHRYPVDCYRFYPDSYAAVADWAGLRLVHSRTDERGPWRDIVGVFQSGGDLVAATGPRMVQGTFAAYDGPIVPEHEKVAGAMPYLEVLAALHSQLAPRRYLEIGVRDGKSLALAQCETVAVDPWPSDTLQTGGNVSLYKMTSDDFFFFHGQDLGKVPFDLAFIDGMHLAENVLRDFMYTERVMAKNGVIVVDDVLPNHPVQAARDRQSRVWTGDVWRFAALLAKYRPDLKLRWIDTAPSGLLVISGLDPTNTVLWDQYNYFARELDNTASAVPGEDILTRSAAIAPAEFLRDIRQ